jgi:hypothetical protein
MSKHKKTRKEKVIADYRHKLYAFVSKNLSPEKIIIPTATITENNYSSTAYVVKDVLKTGILTLTIVALQIILFFLLTRHIINLPFVKY